LRHITSCYAKIDTIVSKYSKRGKRKRKKTLKEKVEFIRKKRRKKGKQREFTGLFKTSLDLSSFV
jgi:hypothetical protein